MEKFVLMNVCDSCGEIVTEKKCDSCGKLLCDDCAVNIKLPDERMTEEYSLKVENVYEKNTVTKEFSVEVRPVTEENICMDCFDKYYKKYYHILDEIKTHERAIKDLKSVQDKEFRKIKTDKEWRDY